MTDPANSRFEDSYDVKFLVGPEQRTFNAHKFILACQSTVFNRMFYSEFPSEREISITDIEPDIFEKIINSIYGQKLVLNADNIAQIYSAADKYHLCLLQDLCKNFVMGLITPENVLSLLNTYHHYNEAAINEKCLSIILEDPLSFFAEPEFLEAPADVIRGIFVSCRINCSVQDVKRALSNWLKAQGLKADNTATWYELVVNNLQLKREEVENKMVRHHLFQQYDYDYADTVAFGFSGTDPINLAHFELNNTQVFLHGFGLVMGVVSQESFGVVMKSKKGSKDLGMFTVEKQGPKDVASVQNVFFKKMPIGCEQFDLEIRFNNNNISRPRVKIGNKSSYVPYLILSKMHCAYRS